MKNKIWNITAILFATFLFFATLEVIFVPANTASAKNDTEGDALEVPLTGSSETKKPTEIYETLVEIAFLALTGAGFYVINTRRGNKT